MKNLKGKYLVLLSILLTTVLINIILLHRPLHTSVDRSILQQIPIIFWLILIITSGSIIFSVILSRSKAVSIMMVVLYYIIFYIFNFFYKILPTQTDIGDTSYYMDLLNRSDYINPNEYSYFEFPTFFVTASQIQRLLGLDTYSTINLGFMLLLITFPIMMILLVHKKIETKTGLIYFIAPVCYLILVFYAFNDQFVPQFLGLIFLIATIGSYIQYKESRNIRFFYLTLVFYILCVFSHPFIFFFFILSIIIMKFYKFVLNLPFTRWMENYRQSEYDSIYSMIIGKLKGWKAKLGDVGGRSREILSRKRDKILGRVEGLEMSVIVLLTIYYFAFRYRFFMMRSEFRDMMMGESQGGSWILVSYLFGENREILGIQIQTTYPLYHIVPQHLYLSVRYSVMLSLFIISIILFISFIRMNKNRILPFDLHVIAGGIVFLFAGFLNLNSYGSRSLQSIFMNVTKYFQSIFYKRTMITKVLIIVLILAPALFSINICVNLSLSGELHVEDLGTLTGGKFVNDHSPENVTVIVPDRLYYPIPRARHYQDVDMRLVTPGWIARAPDIHNQSYIAVYTPKLENRMLYFSIDSDEIFGGDSIIFDQGSSQIIIGYS